MAAKSILINPAILNDYKIWQLDDDHWRFYIEFCLIFKSANAKFLHIKDIAWWLRRDKETVHVFLANLYYHGLVDQRNKDTDEYFYWFLPEQNHVTLLPDDEQQNWATLRKTTLERDDNSCVYCGNEANAADHIFPRNLGGQDEIQNLVAACKSCNSSKSDKLPYEWFKQQPSFSEVRWAYINAVQNGQIKTRGDAIKFMEQVY